MAIRAWLPTTCRQQCRSRERRKKALSRSERDASSDLGGTLGTAVESAGYGHRSKASLRRCADAVAGFFLSARHCAMARLAVCVTPFVPEIVTVVVLDTV